METIIVHAERVLVSRGDGRFGQPPTHHSNGPARKAAQDAQFKGYVFTEQRM